MAKRFFIGSAIISIVGFLIFSLVQAQTPATPTNLQVQAVSSCALRVSWTPPANANAYDAERNGIAELDVSVSDEAGKKVFTDADNDTLWQAEDAVDHIDPGETYSFRVRAKNTTAGTQSGWAGAVSGTTNALPAKPGAPRNMATTFNTGRIDLEWNVNTPTSTIFSTYGGFEVWRAVSNNGGNNYPALEKLSRIPSSQIVNNKYFYNDNQNIDPTNSYKYVLKTQEVGGEGCDMNRSQHVIFSDPSADIIIPAIPSNLSAQFVESPRKISLSWNDNSRGQGNETRFQIERSTVSNFDPAQTISFDASSNATSYDDTNIEAAGTRTYWYRLRSCVGNYCSSFTAAAAVATGILAPANFRAVLTKPTIPQQITLSWEIDTVLSGQQYEIQRNGSALTTILDSAARNTATPQTNDYIYVDNNVSAGQAYTYQIRTRVPSKGDSNWVTSQPVSTDITTIKGWAWIGSGLGWVRLSNDSDTSSWGPASGAPNESATPYGVFLNNVSRKLSGYAWSPYAGWLSFNESELTGCPQISGYERSCTATLEADGRITGWAKFLYDGQGNGLDRWVSLNSKGEPDYGLRYATSTDSAGNTIGELRGFAWGGDTIGWLTFGGPILKNVVQKTDSSFDVTYENQMDYSRVEIYCKKEGGTGFEKCNPTIPPPANRNTPQNPQHQVNVSIPNVEPNTNYQFKVRGILSQ